MLVICIWVKGFVALYLLFVFDWLRVYCGVVLIARMVRRVCWVDVFFGWRLLLIS